MKRRCEENKVATSKGTTRENTMRKKNIICTFLYVAMGLAFIISLGMLFSMKLHSQTGERILFDNTQYHEKEKNYRKEIKTVLSEYGLETSGITMTRVVELSGERAYQVAIHNQKFDAISEDTTNSLMEAMDKCAILDIYGNAIPVEIVLEGSCL